MDRFFDIVYQDRAVSAPVDYDRGFFGMDCGVLDAPQCIPAGSTESVDEIPENGATFQCTSYHFRPGF